MAEFERHTAPTGLQRLKIFAGWDVPKRDPKRRKLNGSMTANSQPYEIEYFAKKHDISREQARELFRRIGIDRDKLNTAASKLFRK